jgi:hypothetical protein
MLSYIPWNSSLSIILKYQDGISTSTFISILMHCFIIHQSMQRIHNPLSQGERVANLSSKFYETDPGLEDKLF